MAYADEGKDPQARDAYGRAIALEPKNPIPYYNLGNTYLTTDKKTAVEYWRKALNEDPSFLPAKQSLEAAAAEAR